MLMELVRLFFDVLEFCPLKRVDFVSKGVPFFLM
jgi:hypothetical protein